ncbi:RlpA-like double-psi beta-barrel-protein domain-containing protein-containing protein [Dichotomocladium elegans]|nr:RlpA-like double-psi beta-barrel-protein domain-containing protein-containing protein [Dichotomocladium elegans]
MQAGSFITLFFLLGLALVPATIDALPALERRKEYWGYGTFFNVGLGSCGMESVDSDMVVALSFSHMQSGACGRRIKATSSRGSITCTVVDTCPACGENDIDFSPAAFEQIGDPAAGRVSIHWTFE